MLRELRSTVEFTYNDQLRSLANAMVSGEKISTLSPVLTGSFIAMNAALTYNFLYGLQKNNVIKVEAIEKIIEEKQKLEEERKRGELEKQEEEFREKLVKADEIRVQQITGVVGASLAGADTSGFVPGAPVSGLSAVQVAWGEN
jgi:hypothetical protein